MESVRKSSKTEKGSTLAILSMINMEVWGSFLMSSLFIKENLRQAFSMGKGLLNIKMVKSSKEISNKTKEHLASIRFQMDRTLKALSKTTCRMETGSSTGQTG